jgi:hypothetical protein
MFFIEHVFHGLLQILSLCSFVLSNCYEKCNSTQNQITGKKKKHNSALGNKNENTNTLLMKEKIILLTEILKEVKITLNFAEISLGENMYMTSKKGVSRLIESILFLRTSVP